MHSSFLQEKAEILNPFFDKQCARIENVCKHLAKNIKLYGSWSASKFSIFQTNNLVSQK